MNYTSPAFLAQYWSDMQQSGFIQQLLAANGTIWLQIGLMVILCWLIGYRSEQIRYPARMRWSYRLLVGSLVVPPMFNVLIAIVVASDFYALMAPYSNSRRGMEDLWLIQASTVIGPVLLAGSLYLGFASLALGPNDEQARTWAKRAVPQKHPLD